MWLCKINLYKNRDNFFDSDDNADTYTILCMMNSKCKIKTNEIMFLLLKVNVLTPVKKAMQAYMYV